MAGVTGGGAQFGFEDWSDKEFHDRFVSIISRGAKNNTYKFAWAKFLLDYSHSPGRVPRMFEQNGEAAEARPPAGDSGIKYADIARYFFVYYWPLTCKTRLRQGPATQPPVVTTEIERVFDEGAYPQSVDRIIRTERAKVDRCVVKIAAMGLKDVAHRFQKVKGGEERMFYQYVAGKPDRSGNRKLDRKGGILLNPDAIRFLGDNYEALNGALTAEWLRAIESHNFGSPNLVERFGGRYGRRNQRKFLPVLEAFGRTCFYCGKSLGPGRCVHVDHVLPFDYMGDTELWNLVLACRGCNCEKMCSLPPTRYVDKLMRRNADHGDIEAMAESLSRMTRFERGIEWHYENARRHGYRVAEVPAVRA